MPDRHTPEQRSYNMSRVKGKDTGLELTVRNEFQKLGFAFDKNVRGLPGKPDVVFWTEKVAVFIDGDFWHGYRFSIWENTLPPFWKNKIGETRKRDQRNFRKLRRLGWKVIRIWEHQIHKDLDLSVERVVTALESKHAIAASDFGRETMSAKQDIRVGSRK